MLRVIVLLQMELSVIAQRERYASSGWSGIHADCCCAHNADVPFFYCQASPDYPVSTSMLHWWC